MRKYLCPDEMKAAPVFLQDLSELSNDSSMNLAVKNMTSRPPGLEKQVEMFKRQNLSLRVEVYYLKTRLREAGIVCDSPEPREYESDMATLNGSQPAKDVELDFARNDLERLNSVYKERARVLQEELEEEKSKSQAAEKLRLKCQKFEQEKKALQTALDKLKNENCLLRNAMAAMNESGESDNSAIFNTTNKNGRNLLQRSTLQAPQQGFMKGERRNDCLAEAQLIKITVEASTMTSAIMSPGNTRKSDDVERLKERCLQAESRVEELQYLMNQRYPGLLHSDFPANTITWESTNKEKIQDRNSKDDDGGASSVKAECKKCRKYEQVLAAIRRKFAGKKEKVQDEATVTEVDKNQTDTVDDSVNRWLQKSLCSPEDREAFKQKFRCIYSVNGQLCKRMQESASALKEVCAKLADNGIDISDLTELHILQDDMLSKLNATQSLITALETSMSLAMMPSNEEEKSYVQETLDNMQVLLQQRDDHIEMLKATIRNKIELIECLKRRLDEAEANRFGNALQTANNCYMDAAVQCKTTFDSENFQWPTVVLSMFPGLDVVSQQFIFFLDVLADIVGGDCTEEDKQRLILNLCEHFRESLLPCFQTLETRETSSVAESNDSKKTEREEASSITARVSDAMLEDSSHKKTDSNVEIAQSTALNGSWLRTSQQHCCLAPGVTVALCKETRTALELADRIQKSQNEAEVKERFRGLTISLQHCVDFSQKLFFHVNNAGMMNVTLLEEAHSGTISGAALSNAELLQSNSRHQIEEISSPMPCYQTDVATPGSSFVLNASATGRIQLLLASNQRCNEQMEAAVEKMSQNNREMEKALLKRKKMSKEMERLRELNMQLAEENCKANEKISLLEQELAQLKRQVNSRKEGTLAVPSGGLTFSQKDFSTEVRMNDVGEAESKVNEGILSVDNGSKSVASRAEADKITELEKQASMNAELLAELEVYKEEWKKAREELDFTLKSLHEEQETKVAAANEITEDLRRTANLFRKLKHKSGR